MGSAMWYDYDYNVYCISCICRVARRVCELYINAHNSANPLFQQYLQSLLSVLYEITRGSKGFAASRLRRMPRILIVFVVTSLVFGQLYL